MARGVIQEAIREDIVACAEFVGAGHAVIERFNHLPAETECPAMTDLAEQHTFEKVPESHLVDDLQSYIALEAMSGLDSIQAFVTLVAGDPSPIWSHLVVARVALEALSYVRWLAETPMQTDARIRRGLLVGLRDAFEMLRYQVPELKAAGRARKDSIRAVADANGWVTSLTKKTIHGDQMIEAKVAIERVLGGAGDPDGLGPIMWSYLSGASHGFPYALLQSATQQDLAAPGPVVLAQLHIEASTVHSLTGTMLLAGLVAWDARCRYMGWQDDAWIASTAPTRRHLNLLHARISQG